MGIETPAAEKGLTPPDQSTLDAIMSTVEQIGDGKEKLNSLNGEIDIALNAERNDILSNFPISDESHLSASEQRGIELDRRIGDSTRVIYHLNQARKGIVGGLDKELQSRYKKSELVSEIATAERQLARAESDYETTGSLVMDTERERKEVYIQNLRNNLEHLREDLQQLG